MTVSYERQINAVREAADAARKLAKGARSPSVAAVIEARVEALEAAENTLRGVKDEGNFTSPWDM